ncbi:glycoside hydrolase family 38 C-terminal domain-containing protein [Opitutus sp. ER46]|uniref:glycoside hydrolase family 38 N-terminal domain-containing protein n=1 Tax=Opitutus sp. ER46 TaxID=2161864 RepID=UPI000D310D10|nr:glycoside hydrolase family 38 C-terminal domain-containing protein [Opitutus sp. ER46]PTY00382.1 alpha-mannosidase [Opitutus sp. ER46]
MPSPLCRLALLVALAAALPNGAPAANAPTIETFARQPDRPVDVARDRNLYVIGYAHLDTQWRWTYPRVIREFIPATLRKNFALLDQYPNYTFNFTGSRRYEMMQEYYPADYQKLKRYVAAGRWFPAGSSVDEADSLVPSAESLLRQILYGNRFFRREFGLASNEFMLPDCFGFPAALPTILAHAGIKGFSTQKLTVGTSGGIPFKVGVWEGPDGSSVVSAFDPGPYYGQETADLSKSESWLKRIEATGQISGAYVDYHYYGIGDQGGAPNPGSVRWIERSLIGGGPVRVISSTTERMFNDLAPAQVARLPHYRGELLLVQHSAAAITSQAYMKRWNRKNELLADAAERATVAAFWLRGAPYPARKLYDAWNLVLGSQMHDMLPGTSVPKAYEYCWNDEILAANLFASVVSDAVGAVTTGLDTRAEGTAIVVYNPLSIERDDLVEAELPIRGPTPAALVAVGPDHRSGPVQIVGRQDDVLKILFLAHAPAVGFSTYDIRPAQPGAAPAAPSLRVEDHTLENEHYRVTIDANGDIGSVFDKTLTKELLAAPARLELHPQNPERYPAWNMDWRERQQPARSVVAGPARIRLVETGPVRVAIEVERETEGSSFTQTIRLAAGAAGDRIEIATLLDWQTRETVLKAAFPLTSANAVATYDSQVGTVQRENNHPRKYEVPQHQWIDLTRPDESYGVALLNDSKYASDKPDDQTLRLTLVLTPGVRNRFQDQASQDIGRHEILYALAGHSGDWRKANVPWQAARLNQPLLAFRAPSHDGVLGRTFSLFKVSSGQVALAAVKKAEDSDEIIVRFKELTGKVAGGLRLSAAVPIVAAREVDGQEQPLGDATVENGELAFSLRGYGLKAFALKLGPPPATLASPVSQPVTLPYTDDVVSTNEHRHDGHFDAAGRAYPAEQFPGTLVSEGITFALGPTADGQPNAMAARGQSLAVPTGDFNRLYLLAAADGDTAARFLVDGHPVDLTVQNWTGYIGQWDNRLWGGTVPESVFYWFKPLVGLEPGFTKRDAVAWYASHRHTADSDDAYQFCYLFKYRIDLPAGAKTLTLPDTPKLRIFAVSAAQNLHDDTVAASPLYDRLDDHRPTAPRFSVAAGRYADTQTVSILPPLYWRTGGLRYTLDGTEPGPSSPQYEHPITVSRDLTLQARELDPNGVPGPLSRATIAVTDTTAPHILTAASVGGVPSVRVEFSEPVTRTSAENVANYAFDGPAHVTAATLSPDGRAALLTLSAPLTASARVTVGAIRDTSPQGNALPRATLAVTPAQPVFRQRDATAPRDIPVARLPSQKGQAWTMNVFVKATTPPPNRTLIAGFGRADNKVDGTGRYFATFANGIHLWLRNPTDVESTTPLTIGRWQMLTATYDGTVLRLFSEGRQISSLEVALPDDEAVVRLAPIDPWDKERTFSGDIRHLTIWSEVLSAEAIQTLLATDRPE